MAVTIRIPSPLLRYSDHQTELDVEAETIESAFEGLFETFPGLRSRILDARGNIPPYLILVHAGEEVARDDFKHRAVASGDIIDIVPAVEGGGPGETDDVRMRGFRQRSTVDVARAESVDGLAGRREVIPVAEASGRKLTAAITSTVNVPSFDRSAMDGFAICGEDSFGATLYDPVRLELVGEVMPGQSELPTLARGQALRIMTGAPIPWGADAVLMAEDAKEEGQGVLVHAPVTPGKNVGKKGEDIAAGSMILSPGRRLRPQDVALMASIDEVEVEVVARPRVAILVSGNEIVACGERRGPGQIVDSNTPLLRALIEADGGEVTETHRLADNPDLIREALLKSDVDILIAAGGSSVGREDWLPVLLRDHGELPIHGVAMRPSSPTGIGRLGKTKVFLLPGNPVSCLAAYDFFAGPAIRILAGFDRDWPHERQERRLARRISSQVGRLDYLRVKIREDGQVEPLALSGASILSSTTRADGFVLVDADSEGQAEGETVCVYLYDQRRVQDAPGADA